MYQGPGIPLLYFVAAAGFTLRYWVEKYMDLRVYKRPPLYSAKLVGSFDEVLMALMSLHSILATYFIGVAGGEQPATNTITLSVALGRLHCIPMICVVVFAISCLLFRCVYT